MKMPRPHSPACLDNAGGHGAGLLHCTRIGLHLCIAAALSLPAAHFPRSARTAPAGPLATAAPVSPWHGFRGEGFPAMRKFWDRPTPASPVPAGDPRVEAAFRLAERNARLANEAFYRSHRFVAGWLAHADPATGLIPRNLQADYWNGRDAGADNYPFMVLAAAMTDRPLLAGRMLEMLRTETRLTSRAGRLPDDYSFSWRGWRRDFDLDALIFDGAEYVKDGLLPITEWLGPSPWSARALGIIDDIWKNATVATPFGRIPGTSIEVHGDLLQACARLYWATGDRKYLDWAIRLGDHYLLGARSPLAGLPVLALSDHGGEIINGLAELYVTVKYAAPEKRRAYEQPLHDLYDRILAVGRNPHGLLYDRVDLQSGAHSDELTDNWGYSYDGIYAVFLIDGTVAYRDAVRRVLGNLRQHYSGYAWEGGSADGYADAIEGALTLFNREPIPSAGAWIDSEIRRLWARQHPDGIIEGWHGDGNFARTSLMYALWKTQGTTVQPWRADVRFGAVRDGDRLFVSLVADGPWRGRLVFDKERHRLNLGLPLDYPRINQFPEWFAPPAEACYEIRTAGGRKTYSGAELANGIAIALAAGEELRLVVTPAGKGRC